MNEHSFPTRINQNIILQHIADETLIYDESRHKAFCLNRIAAAVWNECDGLQDAPQIAAKVTLSLVYPISREIVDLALAQLSKDGLLQVPLCLCSPVDAASLSRRSLMARAGVGALLLLPMVSAIEAPLAAQAYSGGVDLPTSDSFLDDPIASDPTLRSGSSSSLGSSSIFSDDPK